MVIDDEMDAVIQEFLIESHENLDRLDADLVALEASPSDPELLGSIFRTLHTIKGTAGFFAFVKLEAIAHAGEDLLNEMREGRLALDGSIVSALLQMVDMLRLLLANVEENRQEGDDEIDHIVVALEDLCGTGASAPKAATTGETQVLDNVVLFDDLEEDAAEAAAEDPPERVAAPPAATPQTESANTSRAPDTSKAAFGSLRIDVALLDKLMNLVGELVLTRNQILQYPPDSMPHSMLTATQRLNLITTELQEGVMKTRMQQIGMLWNRLPRVVRDVAFDEGKKVRIEMEGAETELDKTIVEAIKDPLTHIVRNSVDHGIEAPAARAAAGKPEEGLLSMRAYHDGGLVIIEISDDGAGINRDKLLDKALERGVIRRSDAVSMGDREILQLIFEPGLSTAEKVSNVSGRGVGMDVVRSSIEKIGGSVEIQSELGAGTKLRVKIPLTLAIIPALMITQGGERFAIPQVNLLELVRLDLEAGSDVVERIGDAQFCRLREKLLPLVYLSDLLGQTGSAPVDEPGSVHRTGDVLSVVVLMAEEKTFGLVVDEINDTEEIVVKALSRQVKHIQSFAGATILGDGRVALILDVLGLVQMAALNVESEQDTHDDSTPVASEDGQRSLLLEVSGTQPGQRLAVPLSSVSRLEEIDTASIERSCGRNVIQYRGTVLPLIDLFPGMPLDDAGVCRVVVYNHGGAAVGLLVADILDIVEERVVAGSGTASHDVIGTAIVKGCVTDVLDVSAFVSRRDPTLLGCEQAA